MLFICVFNLAIICVQMVANGTFEPALAKMRQAKVLGAPVRCKCDMFFCRIILRAGGAGR